MADGLIWKYGMYGSGPDGICWMFIHADGDGTFYPKWPWGGVKSI